MSDTTPESHPTDAYLNALDRFVVEGAVGEWAMRGVDGEGFPAPRVVSAETGEVILEIVLPDDHEAGVDVAYATGLAVVSVNALPRLTRAVRQLKSELADAVNAIRNLLAVNHENDVAWRLWW